MKVKTEFIFHSVQLIQLDHVFQVRNCIFSGRHRANHRRKMKMRPVVNITQCGKTKKKREKTQKKFFFGF